MERSVTCLPPLAPPSPVDTEALCQTPPVDSPPPPLEGGSKVGFCACQNFESFDGQWPTTGGTMHLGAKLMRIWAAGRVFCVLHAV